MSIRTIIEINHDYLKEAEGVLQDLLQALPHASEKEVDFELRKSNAVRFLARRHHSDEVEVRVNERLAFVTGIKEVLDAERARRAKNRRSPSRRGSKGDRR